MGCTVADKGEIDVGRMVTKMGKCTGCTITVNGDQWLVPMLRGVNRCDALILIMGEPLGCTFTEK